MPTTRPRRRSSSTRRRSSSAKPNCAAAQVNLGYTNIVSPVDGTVVSRNVTIGQTVAASFQTPTLFLIATDLTKMQVDTNVSESDIGGVKDGQQGDASRSRPIPNAAFTGAVVQVRQAPQTVQNVVTYDVVVGVDNPRSAAQAGHDGDDADHHRSARRCAARARSGAALSRRAVWRRRSGARRDAAAAEPQAASGCCATAGRSACSSSSGSTTTPTPKSSVATLQAGDQVIVGEQRRSGAPATATPRPRAFGF